MRSKLFGAASAGVLLALALSATAQAQETSIGWKGAPQFQNDSLTFKVRGRVYTDYVFQEVDGAYDAVTNPSGTGDFSSRNSRLRTARLGVEGTWNQDWAYKAEVNFTGGQAVWEDLILEYKPNDMTSLMVGNFKTVSLENITSSRYTTFMERGPFNDVLDIGRVLNIGAKMNGSNWTAAAFVSGDSVNNADVNGEERVGVNGRVTFAPVDTDDTKVHLGAWARYRDSGDEGHTAVPGGPAPGGEMFRYRNRNNSAVGDRYVDSGASYGEKDRMFGLEGAVVHKSFSVQAEAARAGVDRFCATLAVPACTMGAEEGEFTAWYAYASFFPTGETRRYEANKGEFNRIKILNPMTAGGWGAVELGVRYDVVDLSGLETVRRFTSGADTEDLLTPVDRGGEYRAWTLGANWYPFPYVRFMANYTMAENDNPQWANPFTDALSADRDVDVSTLQFRAQFDF
jgi:phosphate-selective porin OprO/OprP